MRQIGFLLLRVGMGGLMVFWGLDKVVNVDHGMAVAETFYLGIGTNALFLNVFGVAQAILGVLIVVGLFRRLAYPVLAAICLVTALGVWRSIVDPWGWYLEGTNVLFYPSLIIFGAALSLWGSMSEDSLCLDRARERRPAP